MLIASYLQIITFNNKHCILIIINSFTKLEHNILLETICLDRKLMYLIHLIFKI